jgi:hypothetical protein
VHERILDGTVTSEEASHCRLLRHPAFGLLTMHHLVRLTADRHLLLYLVYSVPESQPVMRTCRPERFDRNRTEPIDAIVLRARQKEQEYRI